MEKEIEMPGFFLELMLINLSNKNTADATRIVDGWMRK